MLPPIHALVSNLRPHLLKAAIIAFAAAPFVVAGGCSFVMGPTAKGPKSATAQHAPGSPIHVESRNGSVEIIAEPARSDVQIDATITCAGATQQEADQRLAQATLDVSRDTSHVLTIKPTFPGGPQGNDGASFVIRIPDADGVTVKTNNGQVEVTSLKGALHIDTSNGPVSVTNHDGSAIIDSSNGPITVKNLSGDLKAHTSNAPVEASAIKGKADLRSSNGGITLVLDNGAVGPIMLDTSNGPIHVTVGKAFKGDISLDTSNGSITIAGDGVKSDSSGRNDAVVHLGVGEKSVVKTSNGHIEFGVAK